MRTDKNERRILFWLDRDLINQMKSRAAIKGYRSLKAWLIEAIQEKLAKP